MFKTFARIIYDPKTDASKFNSWWVKADVHGSISTYYRWWIERELGLKLNTPMWKSHVSVVRGEQPKKPWNWKKHEGKRVEITYFPDVRVSETYAWLQVHSPELEALRVELGLNPNPRVAFHLTLGNTKNLTAPKGDAPKLPFRVFPWEDVSILDTIWRKPTQ